MIRPATPADAPGIAYVHLQSWRETYVGMVPQAHLDKLDLGARTERWTRQLTAGAVTTFVCEVDGKIVGFVCGGKPQQLELGFTSELHAMYLLKSHQGKGWGRKLFDRFRESMKTEHYSDLYLWVVRENPTAHFYQKMGGEKRQSKNVEIGGQPVVEDLFLWQL